MNDIIKKVESACERLAEATNKMHLVRWEEIRQMAPDEKEVAKQAFYEDLRSIYNALGPNRPTFDEAVEQRARELGIKTKGSTNE